MDLKDRGGKLGDEQHSSEEMEVQTSRNQNSIQSSAELWITNLRGRGSIWQL